jgi:carboxylesterase type B
MSDLASNAGLYDQWLALEWMEQNIHQFGGHPQQATVIRETAGAGSVLAQLSSFGGISGASPFQRVILEPDPESSDRCHAIRTYLPAVLGRRQCHQP